MRVALLCDSPVIGRILSDLLALLRYEVVASPSDGTAQLSFHEGVLTLHAPDGTAQPLSPPLRLAELAQHLQQLEASTRGAPLTLAGGWRLEPPGRMLHHEGGRHVPLTEKECGLLTALHAALPVAAPRDALLRDVWAYETGMETHTLETHIYRLRQKLAELTPRPADIVTEDGSYRLMLA